MEAMEWDLAGGFLLLLGAAVLTVSQVLLGRWRRKFERE